MVLALSTVSWTLELETSPAFADNGAAIKIIINGRNLLITNHCLGVYLFRGIFFANATEM